LPGKTRTLTYHSTPHLIQDSDKPTNPHHAIIHNNGQKITLKGAAPINKPQRELSTPQTNVEEEWGIQIQLEGNEEIIIEAIWHGTAIAVSDGSFQNQAGAAAWTIKSATKEHRIVEHGRTPGLAADQSAYQSKLFGLWGIVHTLTQLTDKHKLHEGRIMVACNRLLALQQAQWQPNQPDTSTLWHHRGNPNLEKKTMGAITPRTFPRSSKCQRNDGANTTSMDEHWNGQTCEANHQLWSGPTNKIPYTREPWCCYVAGLRLVKNIVEKLRDHTNSLTIEEHWDKKVWYKKGHKSMIDYEMAGQAIRNSPLARQCWVAKTAARFLPYGTNMKRWNQQEEDQCLWCHKPAESKDHLTQCQAPGAIEQWTKALQSLDNWMQKSNTDPTLRNNIIKGLTRWNQNKDQNTREDRSKAAQEQDILGWDLVLEGAISKKWRIQQEAHWKMYKSWKSSKQWTTELLKWLMNTAWDMWQHRNQALHKEPDNHALILKQEINNKVTKMYQLGLGVFITGATLMKCPLPDLLQLPLAYKTTGLTQQR